MVHSGDMPSDDPSQRTRPWVGPALLVLGAITLSAVLLRLEGRLWICSCGDVYLWWGDIWSSGNSQHLADPYTLTHLLHGIMFFWILLMARRIDPAWRFAIAICAEALWEVVENSSYVIERYRTVTVSLGYSGDTFVNSMGDIAICGAGFALTSYLGVRRSIYLFVSIELLLLLWIRDGLILNIIMLIYPVESILNWQMG
jgi:hypothetical protein